MKIAPCLFAALLVVACCACEEQKEVLSALDNRQAIEVVVALGNSGISAESRKSGSARSASFGILVSPKDEKRALELLAQLGFPRQEESMVSLLIANKGIVPNTLEIEQFRLDRLLAEEAERLINAYPGILDSRVLVRSNLIASPARRGNDKVLEPASVSVVIRYLSEAGNQPFSEADIKKTLLRAVPGLSAEHIAVSSTRVFLASAGKIDSTAVKTEGQVDWLSNRMLITLSMVALGAILIGAAVGAYLASKALAKRR